MCFHIIEPDKNRKYFQKTDDWKQKTSGIPSLVYPDAYSIYYKRINQNAFRYNASISSIDVGRGLPPVQTSLNAATANAGISSSFTLISCSC